MGWDADGWALAISKQMAKGMAQDLAGVGVNWDLIHEKSISTLQETAANAKATYDYMASHASQFTRGALQEQLEKVRETAFAATAMGQQFAAGEAEAAAKAHTLAEALKKVAEEAKAAALEAKKLHDMGSSFTYDLTTVQGVEQYRSMNPGMQIDWTNEQLIAFALAGGTLQQLLQRGIIHMRPFLEGGPTGAGGPAILHPDEYVVPKGGALVMQGGGGGSIAAGAFVLNFFGQPDSMVKQVKQTLMDSLIGSGWRPPAGLAR